MSRGRIAPGQAQHIEKMATRYAEALRATGTRRVDVRVVRHTIYVDGAGYRLREIKAMTRQLEDRQPGRGWARARNFMGDDRFHFFAGGARCLCGRWQESDLFSEREDRRPIISADARDCVAKWQQRFEPTRRIYERPLAA
jgi:hypothetical protein